MKVMQFIKKNIFEIISIISLSVAGAIIIVLIVQNYNAERTREFLKDEFFNATFENVQKMEEKEQVVNVLENDSQELSVSNQLDFDNINLNNSERKIVYQQTEKMLETESSNQTEKVLEAESSNQTEDVLEDESLNQTKTQFETELEIEEQNGTENITEDGLVQEEEHEVVDIPVLYSETGFLIVAYIEIPKIDIEYVIVKGVEKSAISKAIGYFPDTALPGMNGNFCLAGHRGGKHGVFFKYLNELEIGDEIIITDLLANEYIYEVTESFTVEATDVWVLNQTEDATITLVTCNDNGKRRLIVKGKLKCQ